MLKPALIVLTMMGCDCDEQLCFPLDAPARHFSTIGECEAALSAAIDSETYRQHPLLKAQCDRQSEPDVMLVAGHESGATRSLPDAGERGVVVEGLAYAGRTGEYLVYRTADGVVAMRDGLGWAIDRVQGGASRALEALAR
jgi:hypothetical protein